MNLHLAYNEWGGLTKERRSAVVENLMHILLRDVDQFEDFILDILENGSFWEQDDYFGTEGAQV